MHILIAPDSFKESLSAVEVCEAIAAGLHQTHPNAEIVSIPMADGGEGTVDALIHSQNGTEVAIEVSDPLMRPVSARYGRIGDTAVIEMAQASGLELLTPEERNPLITSTYGTGELIHHALEHGCHEIIVGIGGSATNDGGVGMLTALGAKFLDQNGNTLNVGGESLNDLYQIDLSGLNPLLQKCQIRVACDVINPLTGVNGATHVFAPQKGADVSAVAKLEAGLTRLAQVTSQVLGHDYSMLPGTGAAGGLGFGLVAFLGARLVSGFELISEKVGLEKHIQSVDLIITGEGKIDRQTQYGKVPWGVLQLAKKHHKRVIAICGIKGDGADELGGFEEIHSLVNEQVSPEVAMRDVRRLLVEMGREWII